MELNLKQRASDDLIIAVNLLLKYGVFDCAEDVVSFFDKPWKWEEEVLEAQEWEEEE
jgi:hypothetical protein